MSDEQRTGTDGASVRHLHNQRGLRTRTYNTWRAMLNRCRLPTADAYEFYGGRGISVCERWLVFENFLADMGERPAEMTLERKDSNGHYEQSNCIWARHLDQVRNRRSGKLTWDLAEEIRGRVEHGESRRSVARRLSVSVGSVDKIVAGINWRSR